MGRVKKSDQQKPWNQRPTTARYQVETRPINKRFLIFCEGQTEKHYFESFPVLTAHVKCVDMKGMSKTRLINECIARVNALEKKGEVYNHIWCVYDMDADDNRHGNADFDDSIRLAKKNGIRVAYSNDSFELWFYLHYRDCAQMKLRDYYYKKLAALWGYADYEKEGKTDDNCRKNYKRLAGAGGSSQQKAIERAKALYNACKHLPCYQQNPVTMVFQLVISLNKFVRK